MGEYVPHTLNEKNKEDHTYITTLFLLRLRNNQFLKNIITGEKNECFITMINVKGYGFGGTRSVMVIVVGNGHDDTNSNPGLDWLYFI